MPKVVMYCSETCPFCRNAEKLLIKKGVSIEKKSVDEDPSLWDEIEEKTGRDTVPQIFINDKHIGGFDDLSELDMDGELDPLLVD
ncbi:MAG: glutaredoxin 3 [Gammaproteobacteria bacterium]|nr:glutaredoxin 3 [Gammaproteobacteria bacterium]MDH5652281.1 glutaredoxin 3 [Gammaproteobacteria bacterium]